jgi:hypothetical protein
VQRLKDGGTSAFFRNDLKRAAGAPEIPSEATPVAEFGIAAMGYEQTGDHSALSH